MFILVLCALYISAHAASDVITVTEKTWQKEVMDSPVPVFVKFYAPWCGHCKSLAPTWDQIATNLKGVVPIVKVDCTSEQGLCSRYGVKGYPTLKLFKNKKDSDYNGGRDAKSMVAFATSNIKSTVEKITNDAGLDKFFEKNPSVPHVLLFSEKDPSTLYQSLSMRYEGKLVLGQVKKGVDSVTGKYNVESYPHIVTISGDQVDHISEVGKDTLTKICEQLAAGVKVEPPPVEKPAGEQQPPKPKKEKSKPLQEVKPDTLDSTCKGTLCVIGFLSDASDDQKATLETVFSKYSKDGKFTFVFTSCDGEGKALCSKFGVSSAPALVLYNSKKNKVALASSYTVEDISSVMNRALSGDLSWNKLQQQEL